MQSCLTHYLTRKGNRWIGFWSFEFMVPKPIWNRSHLIRSSCSHYCGIQGIEKLLWKSPRKRTSCVMQLLVVFLIFFNIIPPFTCAESPSGPSSTNHRECGECIQGLSKAASVYFEQTLQARLEYHHTIFPLSFGFFDTITFTHTFRLNVSFWSREHERPGRGHCGYWELGPHYFLYSVLLWWNSMQ